ncbi:MAG: hypothetical protein RL087_1189 [Pseudomonadota bacterium]
MTTAGPPLSLSLPQDRESVARAFGTDRRINLQGVWEAQSAARIAAGLREAPYAMACYVDGRHLLIPDEALERAPAEEQEALQHKILEHAARSVGFLYGSHMIGTPQRLLTTPALLTEVHTVLNSPEMLGFIRQLTGRDDIVHASAQATRYQPGNFLTRHNDVTPAEGRVLAYVMGFTPRWHPDWGGLLQFFHDDGRLKDTWVPTFNNMALFDVHHPHSVSFVAPFAPEARYSVTGWFRTVPA